MLLGGIASGERLSGHFRGKSDGRVAGCGPTHGREFQPEVIARVNCH